MGASHVVTVGPFSLQTENNKTFHRCHTERYRTAQQFDVDATMIQRHQLSKLMRRAHLIAV